MNPTLNRRQLLAAAAASLPVLGHAARADKPLRIHAVTFRGMTDVEKGFEEYFTSRKLPVEITYRDINRDATRMPAILDEIRSAKPDLIYTWGTSVTLGVVGPFDGVVRGQHITDIPTVFTLVAAPVQAKIVPDLANHKRNITGVTHVVPTDAQIRAIATYRPFDTLGVLYTPTERNSVVVLDEIRKLGKERGFHTVERTFRLDAQRKPSAEGAADLVRELKDAGAQWLYLPPDSFLGTLAEGIIIPAAMAVGLPTFASTEQLMQAGALSGLVSRYYNVGQFTAHKAERILFGKQPASSLPVEALKRFSYQIRMPAARELKLPPPLSMMGYAELIGAETIAQ
ncbi:MAG: ABC transporter substrate-binding protein [Burkholderiaceae bacterium]|nr:ABC transporter substrate-binding protein [Burkholderiaceae bacterium]